MKKLFVFISAFALVLSLSACGPKELECEDGFVPNEDETECIEVSNDAPVISGETSVSISQFDEFDAASLVTATDTEDGDLDVDIVSNDVDVETPGTYTVVFSAEDSNGQTVEFTVNVTVEELPQVVANYLSGVDLSKLPAEQKAILFAAAERYLLENAYGGIPLYRGASRVMYSSRTQLFSPNYNSVLGFGVKFSQFTEDDSTVLMYDDVYGQPGEYTRRASFNTDPTNLNPWIADDSTSSDFIDLFTGALYNFFFDASKEGFELSPELAADEPQPVDGEEINGRIYATTWQIPLEEGLTWTFHPDYDTSSLPAGYDVLDANDYMWTWKTAFDSNWFRATAGGGDFITQGVKNAAEYAAGSVSWDEVGLKAVDDHTLEITFTSSKHAFDVKYMFGGGSLTPINEQLYNDVNDGAEEDQYGLDPESVAASGRYYFDTWTTGQLLLFKKNDAFIDADMYHYTGEQYRYIDGSDNIFEEFLAGRLDSAAVPSSRVSDFLNDPRVKTSPDATTWRLMINGFKTEEARDAYITEYDAALSNDFVPEPILGYTEARLAFQYGFDRYHAAVEVVGTYLPAFDHFAETYFLDGESGIGVRGTEAGAAILEEFGGDSYGYYPDAAVDLFKQAVDQAIADGYYEAGTASNYTTIELVLTYASSGNTGAQGMVAELESQYEALLVDDENYVRIDIVVNDVAFPNNYYDYMMKANTDLGIGGISGSLLDAPSFLDVYNDNNQSGFTLNWGIDTTTPGVEVVYENLDGEIVSELWGYNALVEALNGKEYVKNGEVQTAWDNANDLIDAYTDMAGDVVATTADGADLAEYILGDTLENIALDEGLDSLEAVAVTTEGGLNILYILQEVDGDYEMYQQSSLYADAGAAMQGYVNDNYGDYPLESYELLADDAAVAANAYIADSYGYTTIQEVADALGIPAEFTEVYATNWGWDDAFVVLHIGDFYIPWTWL
jgi:ABC-type oligopeptide transport system substrate-binding subunit